MTWTIALQIANVLVIPVVGWLMKNALGRFIDRLATVERETAELRAEQKNLIEALSSKVNDEEWIRESMKSRDKLDQLAVALARIEGKTDSTLFVAQAVNRLANSIETTGVKHNAA